MTHSRETAVEQDRINRLLEFIPEKCRSTLDVGARDGYISCKLHERGYQVTALDITPLDISNKDITCVQGDIKYLPFNDNSFDIILCSEVLEHIPPSNLEQSCNELLRVAREAVIIGVPYKQDIRVARTTCRHCNTINPPWGHVNTFSIEKLEQLFHKDSIESHQMVGKTKERTNYISTFLMDLAGNPYGTYMQDELCINCGNKIYYDDDRNLFKKLITKLAYYLMQTQQVFTKSRAKWVHLLIKKNNGSTGTRQTSQPRRSIA